MTPDCIFCYASLWTFTIHHTWTLLSFFYSEAQHEETSFHIETSLCETVWWNESQKESLCYTLVNSWSVGMIVFYAVTDISIVIPQIWMIRKQEFHLYQTVCMGQITGNRASPAGNLYHRMDLRVNRAVHRFLQKLYTIILFLMKSSTIANKIISM